MLTEPPFKVVDRYTTTVIEVSNPNYPSGKVETCLVKTDANGDEYIERYTEYFQEADCSAKEEMNE